MACLIVPSIEPKDGGDLTQSRQPMIDFHTHFFSYPFFSALAAQSPEPGSIEEKLDRLKGRTGLELPSQNVGEHWERWRAMLDANGVDHVVSFASLPDEVPALAEALSLAGGRMSSFALVNPRADGAANKVRTLLSERGFAGVLLFPAMHCFDPGGAEASEVLEAVAEREAIAVVHCGMLAVKLRDLLGLPRPYDFSFADPLKVAPAANRFPRAKFIIPHFGAGMFRETLMLGSLCENVFVDTSSSNSWMATQANMTDLPTVFGRALAVFGPERVVFGTDSSTLPRGWRSDLLEQQRAALAANAVRDADVELILDGNARRLLGLGG